LFFEISGFKRIYTDPKLPEAQMYVYVHDKDDVFVLQDAVSVQADYLLTKNTKDFDIEGIYETYKMSVVSALPLELFFDL
jgi:predicted nucleic acid-binding protein